MDSTSIIAVIGAAGPQGGGLIRALQADPARRFVARAITRTPNSLSVIGSGVEGIEVCFGDLDEPASLEQAFKGAYGVYGVTSYWEHLCPERELAQAYNIATVARRTGVRHIVWSTFEDTRLQVPLKDCRLPTLLGRYKVPHMDAKGESDSFFRDLPTTYLRTSFCWENLTSFGMVSRRESDGMQCLALPMADRKLPGIAASDIGACAFALFSRGADLIGHTVGIAAEHLTGPEMAQALSNALGEPVRHWPLSTSQYAQMAFAGADELANMFQYQHDFNHEFCAQRPVESARALYPGLMRFREWLNMNAARIRRSMLSNSVHTTTLNREVRS